MSNKNTVMASSRQDFKIAIICALTLEAEMVEMIFDKDWADEGIRYGKAAGDKNTYTTGLIGQHNVVLAYCHSIGNNSAAQVATSLRTSFTGIKIVFVVGICGASPFTKAGEEILLGDCIISTGVVQLDFGQRGPNGFQMRDVLNGGAGPLSVEIGAELKKLQTRKHQQRLTKNLHIYLQSLQTEDLRTNYPGTAVDCLYEPWYQHTHHKGDQTCMECNATTGICGKSCVELGCEHEYLVYRDRLNSNTTSSNVLPTIYFGRFGSSNTVLKSGAERDAITKANSEVIAFEMEGSGVWDVYPTVVIKSACDYADSHKKKSWQAYAAGVSAAALKAFLQELEFPEGETRSTDTIAPSSSAKSCPTGTSNSIEFKTSHNYGVQAQVVNGGIHYYNHQSSTVTPPRSELEITAIHEALRLADEAIKNYYKSSERLKIERLSRETLSLDKCYINLALVMRGEQSQSERPSLNLRTRLKLQFGSLGQPVALTELFKSRKSSNDGAIMQPRRIFIQGRAGVGKTTLCKKIVYEFMEDRLGDGLFDRVLWLPLRRLKNTSARYTWRDFLQDAYWPPPQVQNWDSLLTTISEELANPEYLGRSLVLLDGLDEVSRQWSPADGIYQFVQTIICDLPNIILTSRPQASSFRVGTFDMELETTGFTIEQIDTYIDNCITIEPKRSKMKDLIRTKPLLQDLLRIPVQLDAFCCTWSSEVFDEDRLRELGLPSLMNTMTSLYVAISTELLRKDLERIKRHNQPQTLAFYGVEESLAGELKFLEEFAFQGLINEIKDFNPGHQESISRLCRLNGTSLSPAHISVIEQLSFLRSSDVAEHRQRRNYHFLHSTFQDFFAAKHFVRHWRANIALIRLDLISISTAVDEKLPPISPASFLQAQKYNVQYNIFWRFVTGLVQILPEQHPQAGRHQISHTSKNILTLFDELDDKPRDLLTAAHRRLKMYCLSELLPSKRQEIQQLRTNEECLLLQWTLKEFKAASRFILGGEAEFPESILQALLVERSMSSVHVATLDALGCRAHISKETLQIVSNLMIDSSAVTFHRQAVRWWSLSRLKTGFNRTLFNTIINGPCLELNGELGRQSVTNTERSTQFNSLPSKITNTLVAMLEHGNSKERALAIDCLKEQKVLPLESVNMLTSILLLHAKNQYLRTSITEILGKQSLHPGSLATLTTAGLQGNDPTVRFAAEDILSKQVTLPEEYVVDLIMVLKETKVLDIQASIVGILRGRSSLSIESIAALIELAMKGQDLHLRRSSMAILGSQSSLPEEALSMMVATLEEEKDSALRMSAATGLRNRPDLAEAAIDSLFMILEHDKKENIRRLITEVLGEATIASERVVGKCIDLLQRTSQENHAVAIDILGTQLSESWASFSPEAFRGMLRALPTALQYSRLDAWSTFPTAASKNANSALLPQGIVSLLNEMLWNENRDIYEVAMHSLTGMLSPGHQSIVNLLKAIPDQNLDIKSTFINILRQPSGLPPEFVIEIARLFEGSATVAIDRSSIKAILLKQSFLPQEAITALIKGLQNNRFTVDALDILRSQSNLGANAVAALVLLLDDYDKGHDLRRLVIEVLEAQSSLPEEVILALTVVVKDLDEGRGERSAAARAIGKQSSLSQAALAALSAVLQDEVLVYVRVAALEAIGRQSSPPNDLVIAITAMLKSSDGNERNLAIKALDKGKVWLPEETIIPLIAALKDVNSNVRKSAAIALENRILSRAAVDELMIMLQNRLSGAQRFAADLLRGQQIPQELMSSIFVALTSGDGHVRRFAVEIMAKQSDMSPIAIDALVPLLEDKDGSIRRLVVKVLGRSTSLPEPAITALLERLTDPRLDVQSAAAKALKDQVSLSRSAMIALIARLENNGRLLYDILHKHDIYSHISDLDNGTWRQLFASWIEQRYDFQIHCYEYLGILRVHIRGTEHTISQDPLQSAKLIEAILMLVEEVPIASRPKWSPWSWIGIH